MKAIVLAGGKSTRLSEKDNPMPKMLRLADGKPILGYVLESIKHLNINDIMLVLGYMSESIIELIL